MQFPRLVTDTGESRMIVKRIMSLEPCIVGFDMEGERFTSPDGKITLIQLCDVNHNVYLFDILSNKNLMDDGHLLHLLCSPKITKVVHDCRQDSGAIYIHYQKILKNVFDTQMAQLLIDVKSGRQTWTESRLESLKTLCEIYKIPHNAKLKDNISYKMQDNSFWCKRPLTEQMIEYAADDAKVLIPLRNVLFSQISSTDYDLMNQLNMEQIFTMINPSGVRKSKKLRKKPK